MLNEQRWFIWVAGQLQLHSAAYKVRYYWESPPVSCVPFLPQRHETNDSLFVVFENCGYPQWRSLTRKMQNDKSTTKNLHKWKAVVWSYWETWAVSSHFFNICLLAYRKWNTKQISMLDRFCPKYSIHRRCVWSDLVHTCWCGNVPRNREEEENVLWSQCGAGSRKHTHINRNRDQNRSMDAWHMQCALVDPLLPDFNLLCSFCGASMCRLWCMHSNE